MGMAIVIRTTMMVMTTISSTKVNPRGTDQRGLRSGCSPAGLPFGIGRAIGCLLVSLAVDVEHVLAAPTGGLGVVLVAAHTPFAVACKGIAGNPPQEMHFLVFGAGQLHALHQLLQGLGIAVGALLERAERAGIGEILIFVDGIAHVPQVVAQLPLAFRAHFGTRQRHGHTGEDEHDRESHDQLHQGQTSLVAPPHTLYLTLTVNCGVPLATTCPCGFSRVRLGMVTLAEPRPTAWKFRLTST